jgi:hypothetical protein
MHLPRTVTSSTALATAIARPHEVLSHEQLFPLDDHREQRHIYDRDRGTGPKQAPLRDAKATTTSDAATAAHADSFGAMPVGSCAIAAESSGRATIHLQPRSLAGAPATTATVAAVPSLMPSPRGQRRRSHQLQKRQYSDIFFPRRWDGWLLARVVVFLAGLVGGSAIGAVAMTAVELANLSLLVTTILPIVVGVASGLLLIWLGNWAIDRLHERHADALDKVRAMAAGAGLKVKFLTAAQKDGLIARAKAVGQTKQVTLM